VKSRVQGAVDGARATYPSYKIVATGHSLGGALATLAAAELRKAGYTIDLVCMAHQVTHFHSLTDIDSTHTVHRWWATPN
jgi:putative lipase involved disintegration of autophagic bodies